MLVFTMTVIGCKNDAEDDDNGGNGTLTINNIPEEFNGNYVYIEGRGEIGFMGFQSMAAEVYTLCLISNGSVSIPVWEGEGTTGKRYSGNDDMNIKGYIFNSKTITTETADSFYVGGFRSKESVTVTFKNGSATMSWSKVDYYPAE